ncbi:hypothetical protein J421_2817 [Gemmatirosa kalamazoonensis]|jgi:hypothetical protein|uniref:Uncharacterized protein n=1 Tax=Gemmatirosa kalamazoonensis TaxID=861299 RepID=W0RGX5_9BACT|nr:hypothetical protein [Gemmatirosa kalamazoonensis]AHG90354.1 hypothetical protein J421_2817 [Gemmatirosa kalamazoonensis]
MSNQQRRTLQHTRTTLAPAEVLAAAKHFFARRNTIYAAFPEKEGPTFVSLRGQGGEEILIGVATDAEGTQVTGSTYLFDQQLARFFATLPPFPTEDATSGPDDEGGEWDDDAGPAPEKKAPPSTGATK